MPPEVLVFGWYVFVGLSGGVWMFRVKPGSMPHVFFKLHPSKINGWTPQKMVVWKMCLLFPRLGDFQVRFDINFQVPYC